MFTRFPVQQPSAIGNPSHIPYQGASEAMKINKGAVLTPRLLPIECEWATPSRKRSVL